MMINIQTCCRENECVHPSGPVLPIAEFYLQRGTKTGHSTICKECQKAISRHQKPIPREVSSNDHENEVMVKLRALGIVCDPGKCTKFKRVDVVAWGCIRIEVKYAQADESGRAMWQMGHKIGREDNRSDFVVLIYSHKNKTTYHIVPSLHPAFYKINGVPKKGVVYNPNPHHLKGGSVNLTKYDMAHYQNKWEQIEQRRLELSSQLMDMERVGDDATNAH